MLYVYQVTLCEKTLFTFTILTFRVGLKAASCIIHTATYSGYISNRKRKQL